MHALLQLAVAQAQVERQVRILQEEGHDYGVTNAHAPDSLVSDEADEVMILDHGSSPEGNHPCGTGYARSKETPPRYEGPPSSWVDQIQQGPSTQSSIGSIT